MTSPLVYLAGPIAGTGPGESIGWRQRAAGHLFEGWRIKALSPMRAKERLAQQPIGHDFSDYKGRGVFFTSGGIMTRDASDVYRCDVMLVNLLGAREISVGTAMELAWAWREHIPRVVAIEAYGNPHDKHPMVHEAIGPFRVATLDEAIGAVAMILGR